MTPVSIPMLSDSAVTLCLVSLLLMPLAGAGISLINAGLGRARSSSHLMLSSLCVISAAAIAYFLCGFAFQGYMGYPGHELVIAGKGWNWIASGPFFLRRVDPSSPVLLAAVFGMFSAGLAGMIPLGTGADRWRLGAICASTAILAGWTYPLFAHWVWGGGWLAQLGVNARLGRGFVDAGGASTIQVVGGLTALSIAWILGPRRGKYTLEGMPSAIPGHNSVLVLFGCVLALAGWLGLNSAGALLFARMEPATTALVAINTLLSAATAALMSAAITRVRFGKPDASLTANGWVGGLVASSAACAFVVPAEAVVIGGMAGALVTFSIEWFELHLSVDDPSGSVSAHAIGGIWGVLAAGIFGNLAGSSLPRSAAVPQVGGNGQFLAQLVGVATLIGFVLPASYGLNWVLNRFYPYRVVSEGERQGMDLHELGAGAYPDFITHNEDFNQHKT